MDQALHMEFRLFGPRHLEGSVICEVIFHPRSQGVPLGFGLSMTIALHANIVNSLLEKLYS